MSKQKKYRYRALGGAFVVIPIIICGTIALAFLVAGLTLAGLSWLPYIDPEILETYRISFLGTRIIDPSHAFLLFFVSGLTFAAVGFILFGFVYYVIKIIYKDLFSKKVEIKGY